MWNFIKRNSKCVLIFIHVKWMWKTHCVSWTKDITIFSNLKSTDCEFSSCVICFRLLLQYQYFRPGKMSSAVQLFVVYLHSVFQATQEVLVRYRRIR